MVASVLGEEKKRNGRDDRPPEDGWVIAEKRNNRCILLHLRTKNAPENREFVVLNYHNPCLFGSVQKVKAVTLHTLWLFHFAYLYAKAKSRSKDGKPLPRIVCGDFNIKPKASA